MTNSLIFIIKIIAILKNYLAHKSYISIYANISPFRYLCQKKFSINYLLSLYQIAILVKNYKIISVFIVYLKILNGLYFIIILQ